MKKTLLNFLAIAFTGFGFSQSTYKIPAKATPADYMSKTIILKVKENFRADCSEQGINNVTLQKTLNMLGVASFQKIFKNEQPPREKYNREGFAYADLSLIYELKYSGNYNLEKAINALLASNILVYAEPHFIPTIDYNPNDPMATIAQQYHLNKMDCYNAWGINTTTARGDTNVIIGITDTGTDPTHNDLKGNIKHNYADPVNTIDDDADGYVDNFSGWDLGVNDNDPTWQGNAHGVHVCGIAAASTDNAIGVAGVGFKCKFLPVKIADASGSLVAAYEGIKYAADHGCKVINCSWGGPVAGQYGQDICTYATINKDALVVAAAGNNGVDQEFFPAAYTYVIAVANTMANDVKNPSSNIGYFVDVSAPGTSINATWPSPANGYSQQTGTSMASPNAAGAVAIIRSFYPSYSALQAGERLKATTDNNYSVNTGFINKLGTGRVNLFKALSDPLKPAVIFGNMNVVDHNDAVFIGGDTLFISGLFTNYLAPTSALSTTLVSLNSQAVAVNNVFNIGVLNTLANTTNSLTPYSFKLNGSFTNNSPIDFRLDMADGTYTVSQFFTILVNADYINIYINDVGSTATSKGRIGYNLDSQGQGLGFIFGSGSILYDAGLMIGLDSTRVSDCVRGMGTGNDTDFGALITIKKTTIPKSDFDTYAKFDDAPSATTPLGVEVEQRTFAWNTVPNKRFIIWEYIIKNTTSLTLNNVYVGICADWDIDAATFGVNKSAYHAGTKMGYTYHNAPGGKFGGIKLLTSSGSPVFYAIDNIAGGDGGFDLSGGFSTYTKYKTMSTNRLNAGGTGTVVGHDVLNVMSSGPHQLLPGLSTVVAFALIAGDTITDLITSAGNAQIKYDGVKTTDIGIKEITTLANGVMIYPNPATDRINVHVENDLKNHLLIYDASGKLIFENTFQGSLNIKTTGWSRGMYFVKLINEQGVSNSKIAIE